MLSALSYFEMQVLIQQAGVPRLFAYWTEERRINNEAFEVSISSYNK